MDILRNYTNAKVVNYWYIMYRFLPNAFLFMMCQVEPLTCEIFYLLRGLGEFASCFHYTFITLPKDDVCVWGVTATRLTMCFLTTLSF